MSKDLQGLGRKKKRDDKENEDLQPKESMKQDPGQARTDDNKAPVVGASSMNFSFLDGNEEGAETLVETAEPAEDETSTLKPSSTFLNAAHNLPEIIVQTITLLARLKLLQNFLT